jgi:hypothetical protein
MAATATTRLYRARKDGARGGSVGVEAVRDEGIE